MYTQKLELNKMGLAPMSEFEMQEVDGGNIFRTIGAALAVAVGVAAMVVGGWTGVGLAAGAMLVGWAADQF